MCFVAGFSGLRVKCPKRNVIATSETAESPQSLQFSFVKAQPTGCPHIILRAMMLLRAQGCSELQGGVV